ncbi:hypothetical protein [Candidatus Schmidhempelia bombi]|uniref:Uncharacterized protein n=1 Tax=Candidatus Schmidhempelia bombi str. Bimp TaxID=1387197 RepID=A0AB94IA47_9GAMM|nr:hypothetical protein [Candidatus Schmidhempelia bombi]TEA26254.1 hypothetical protein O970_09555 [Candidatus Schmidhempelia bombi str. Bimp]TEA26256.1 hypothetical protein O970_09565 [Candidatus Schmidhempelia bombi str. Bimp]TEA26258.1 hypothetical protein O970_09575 [Candidatus Schmidhempelia bombi str. Bimp]
MSWATIKSLTQRAQSSKVTTKVKEGARRLDKILIRRIPVNLLTFNVGHFWIEFLHEDENEIDESMKAIRQQGLKERDIVSEKGVPRQISTKANGFRESYGWYPVGTPFRPLNIFYNKLIISSDGTLNGDHEKRREKDYKEELTELTPTQDRNAGRKTVNNDHSSRAFDPHQNGHHHPEKIDFTTNPYVLPDDERTDEEIFNDIRTFAEEFDKTTEEWSWWYDSYRETNCHTLLFLLLAHCNLADPDCIGMELDEHFKHYKKSLDKIIKSSCDDRTPKRKQLIKKLLDISKKAKAIEQG